jgi:NagD protein
LSYFIDVQGTLIDDIDKKPINGAINFIKTLNQKNVPYVVVTNNTKKKSEDFYHFLLSLGFEIPKQNYLDPFMVLDSIVSEKNVFCFGPEEFQTTMASLGYVIEKENPKAILIASSKDFSSDDYALMIEKVVGGAKIIGMHATSIYAKEGRSYPGVGAILKMLSYASGKDYQVIGKPSFAFYQAGLDKLNEQQKNIKFEDITMISDDAIGDLLGAKELGMKSVLVLSGKVKNAKEVLHVKDSLDEIVQNIGCVNG